MRQIKSTLALLAMTMAVVAGAGPATAAPEGLVVYVGNNPLSSGFEQFRLAAGRPMNNHSWFREELKERCIILPANILSLMPHERARLAQYVYEGGTLIALTDMHNNMGSINTMNEVAVSVGSTMSVVPAAIDGITTTTGNIEADPLTAGVHSLFYRGTSTVSVWGGARVLARTATGSVPFIGAQDIGLGTFVLAGDLHLFNDSILWGAGGNGALVDNLCGMEATKVTPADPAPTLADAIVKGTFSARLTTARGRSLPDKLVTFKSGGSTLCTAMTGSDGVATCGSATQVLAVAVTGGDYSASFAGDTWYDPSAANGQLFE